MTPPPALAGLRVVELSAFVAAPLACSALAALGADVVRVEPLGGGPDRSRWPLHKGTSLYWAGLNQGKRSVTVDTSTKEGQRLATDMVAEAGMVVTNLGEREWSSYERLSARRPDLIMAVMSGNPDGTPAVDYTVNAAMGFPYVTGPERVAEPVNHVLPAWDALAGHLLAVGLIAAELHRVRTGEGQLVRLSLADVALSVTASLGYVAEAQLNGAARPRLGNSVFGTFVRDFETGDGRSVVVAAITVGQWRRLVTATDTADDMRRIERRRGVDLDREGDRFASREDIAAVLQAWFERRTYAGVATALDDHGVLWDKFQTFEELVRDDPRCSARNPILAELDEPGVGRFLHATSPLEFSRSPRMAPRSSPGLGEHTNEVLGSWLRLSGPELEQLAREGVVA